MTCDECREHLSAFLDRELDPYHHREVEAHLAGCPACQADLAGLERISRRLQDAPSPAEELLPSRAVLSRLPALRANRERAVDRTARGAAGVAILGLAFALWIGLALLPGLLAIHLLARTVALLLGLAREAMSAWLRAPGLGWGLGGVVAGLLVMNALLVLATTRIWGTR
jgi:anti-sigma factor RsiW